MAFMMENTSPSASYLPSLPSAKELWFQHNGDMIHEKILKT